MSDVLPTLVIGASENPERYSYRAILALRERDYSVCAVGKKAGQVQDVAIATELSANWKIDTVTLYLNPQQQTNYYDAILSLRPRRIIFNPGTENPVLEKMAQSAGIVTQEACTLVLLHTGQYHLH